MVSRRNYAAITAVMAIIFFLFQFLNMAKDHWNDYSENQYAVDVNELSGVDNVYVASDSDELDQQSTGLIPWAKKKCVVCIGSNESNTMGEMIGNWALYMKRKISYYESISAYENAISKKTQDTPQFVLVDPDFINWDDTKQIRSLQTCVENGISVILGKLPDASIIGSHKLLRRLLGIDEIVQESVTGNGIHLYSGFLLGGEAIYKADTDEEEKNQDMDLVFPWYHLTNGTKIYIGSEQFDETFDLAVAYLEGASTYYVADHVKARQKAAFVHIDYESSGYTPLMDKDCYRHMDRIFMVSDEVKKHFIKYYPQYQNKVAVFHNMLDYKKITSKAKEAGGFTDSYDGIRLLTVGRLAYQKAYDIAIDAMKIIKDSGCKARWYVLGEGSEREMLEKKIAQLGLQKDFLLLGAVENPYPYYVQTDIYVHATRFEGKSIAIQEAQILGCPVIASDCNGNREQIENGIDGILCSLTPEAIADSIKELIADPKKREKYAKRAQNRNTQNKDELDLLLKMTK